MTAIPITIYAGAHDAAPYAQPEISWPEVADEIAGLCAEAARASKTDLPAIGPYRLREGATRSAEAVEAVTLMMIDVDRGDVSEIEARLAALGVSALVYGSPSDDPEGPADARRVRVVAPLATPIAPDQCREKRLAFAEALGLGPGSGVEGAADPARLFFVGRVAGTGPRYVRRFDGQPLDVASLPAPSDAWARPGPAPTGPASATGPAPGDATRDAAIGLIVGALGDARERQGQRFDLCGALGGYLRKTGWSRASGERVIRAWLPTDDPAIDVERGVRWALGAWDLPSEDVSGSQALGSLVGPDVLALVEQGALLPFRRGRGPGIEAPGARAGDYADDDGLAFGTLSESPARQTFLIPELEIGVGRAYGWLGKSNASKTLTLMQLETDLALGREIFGRFAGPGRAVPVLRIAYEGFAKAAEDYLRLLRGSGQATIAALAEKLRFAEGRRWLGSDSDANREWLLRVTAPFAGGLVVIDPLVAACRGLDENSTEIAAPIYDLEHVSQANGVAFVVAHHLGHQHERSRGSSAIEGAFGATAIVAKLDGNRTNTRLVTPRKLNRHGTEPFELHLSDTNEDGSPWVPTDETRRAGEVSWALRVSATKAPRATSAARKPLRDETISRKAQTLRDVLSDASSGILPRLSASAARSLCSASGADWPDVLATAERMGVRVYASGQRVELFVDPPQAERPAAFAKETTA